MQVEVEIIMERNLMLESSYKITYRTVHKEFDKPIQYLNASRGKLASCHKSCTICMGPFHLYSKDAFTECEELEQWK